jgi:hypothetical protein
MAYRQYTSCVNPGNYVDLSTNLVGISQTILLALTWGFVAVFAASLIGGPAGLYAAIALDSAIITYLYWWLHGRLICLKHDTCLVGTIASLGPSNPLDKLGDNDFTMDVLLAPALTDYSDPVANYQNSVPQGHLVAPNASILAIGRGYVSDAGHKPYITSLHCEFEGDGIHTLLLEAEAVLALLIAALVAELLASALAGAFILLAIFIFLVGLLGNILLATPGAPGAGTPQDINPNLGVLGKGDIVAVTGDWIYDSLHPGWNEIHAVHNCQIIGHIDLPVNLNQPTSHTPWPPDADNPNLDLQDSASVQAALDAWCQAMTNAGTTEAGGNRQNPQNDWTIHPVVDGCNPVVIV